MLSLLCGINFNEDNERYSKHFDDLINNNHVQLLANSDLFHAFVTQLITSGNYQELLNNQDKELLTAVAIACVQCFAQANWLGPMPAGSPFLSSTAPKYTPQDMMSAENRVFYLTDHFASSQENEYELLQDKLRTLLSVDGESVFSIVKSVHLLFLARLLLIECDLLSDVKFIDWWTLRLISLYQQLFEERVATLTQHSLRIMEKLNDYFNINNENPAAACCYWLEAGHFYYQNYNWTSGHECFQRATALSSLNIELIGAYGKRTRFQQHDLPQLLLKVENKRTFAELTYTNSDFDKKLLPRDLELNDDTVLDKVKFASASEEAQLKNANKTISPLEQAVLFCALYDVKKNNPSNELTSEEMSSFIDCLLANPLNWCIQLCTIFLRAKVEASSSRRIERSLLQLETLSDFFKQQEGYQLDVKYRMPFFYSVSFPSFWTLQTELAKFYMKLGLVNSALEIYVNLKMWDDAINCYVTLDKRDKAEELIRQQLETKETAELYCTLGDVTRDTSYYDKAIELSRGRSAKAYRMLAKFQFSKEKYEEAIVNFEKSLEINSMQYDAWFMLGSAAFRAEKWSTSVKAFRACTNLDPDNHETWNNLAASYIKSNQKHKAHTVFLEAIKYDYENWKIWENFLWTSTDCGYFDDTIKAYNRLLDLKEKYVDIDVLKALCSSVEKNLNDAYEAPVRKFKQKLLQLFGRITSLIVNNWQIYWCYATIVLVYGQVSSDDNLTRIELDAETADKYFTLLQKSLRCLLSQLNWEASKESCLEVVSMSNEILSKCNEYGSRLNNPRDTFGSLNLSIRSIIAKLKQKYIVDPEDGENNNYAKLLYFKEINDDFVDLQQNYEQFCEKFFSS